MGEENEGGIGGSVILRGQSSSWWLKGPGLLQKKKCGNGTVTYVILDFPV